MGFGLIFLGILMLLSMRVVPAGILGGLLMLSGLSKLTTYGESFRKARNACVCLVVYFLIFGTLWTLNITDVFVWTKYMAALIADEVIYYCVLTVFFVLLFKALGDISKQVGFEKGIIKEKRAISMTIVFAIFTAIKIILSPFGFGAYLELPVTVFELIWLVYSAIYAYSCYMMIATEEIIDKENRKMREFDEKNNYRMLKNKRKK